MIAYFALPRFFGNGLFGTGRFLPMIAKRADSAFVGWNHDVSQPCARLRRISA